MSEATPIFDALSARYPAVRDHIATPATPATAATPGTAATPTTAATPATPATPTAEPPTATPPITPSASPDASVRAVSGTLPPHPTPTISDPPHDRDTTGRHGQNG